MELQCRLCLCNNSPLEAIVSTELEQLYYSLTLLPMKQSKPLLACYVCLAHLKKVYKIKMKFLLAANYFKSNKEAQQPTISHLSCVLTVSVLQQDNIHPMLESRVASKDIISEDNVKVEIKKEIEDEIESALDGDINNVELNPGTTGLRYEDVKNGGNLENTARRLSTDANQLDISLINHVVKIEPIENDFQDNNDESSIEDSLMNRKFTNNESAKYIKNSVLLEFEVPSLNSKEQNTIANGDSHNQTNEKPCICEYCKKGFSYPSKLENHMRVHVNVKSFKCGSCDKEFYSQFALVHHSNLHKKDTSLKCKICDKSFTNRSHLKRHARTHTGLKPFNCDSCQKTFGNRDSLKKHALTHSKLKPYQCGVCEKTFPYRSTLNIHNRLHTDERSFVCDICQKSFRHRHNLVEHLFTHNKKKPFKCDLCQKQFVYRCNLKRHIVFCTVKTT